MDKNDRLFAKVLIATLLIGNILYTVDHPMDVFEQFLASLVVGGMAIFFYGFAKNVKL